MAISSLSKELDLFFCDWYLQLRSIQFLEHISSIVSSLLYYIRSKPSLCKFLCRTMLVIHATIINQYPITISNSSKMQAMRTIKPFFVSQSSLSQPVKSYLNVRWSAFKLPNSQYQQFVCTKTIFSRQYIPRKRHTLSVFFKPSALPSTWLDKSS